jgi:hypothetical protein
MGCACTFNTYSKSAMSESLKYIVEISLMVMVFASRSVMQVLCCNVLVGRRHFITCIRH